MKKRGIGKKFLELLNSKPAIGMLIFITLSLVSVFAANVIVQDGSLDVEGNTNVTKNLTVGGTIGVGGSDASTNKFSEFGSGQTKDGANIGDENDVFIHDSLEVEGKFYLTGGSTEIEPADIAEILLTKQGRDNVLCEGDSECIVQDYERELDFGDLVCINPNFAQTIEKCTDANSHLVIGFVSNTSKILMGNSEVYGYPIAVAGVVYAKVTNFNGNINPGDLLVSADKDGYAMKNNNPKDGTVAAKAFDFCYEEECKILTFVALS